MAKLTEDEVRKIRASTKSDQDVAIKYGMSRRMICLIRLEKNWRHIL